MDTTPTQAFIDQARRVMPGGSDNAASLTSAKLTGVFALRPR